MTRTELDAIRAAAQARGVTVSSLTRAAVLNVPLPDRRTGIEAEAVAALNRIGVNINQIARAGNAGALTPAQVDALGDLFRKISALIQQIGEKP